MRKNHSGKNLFCNSHINIRKYLYLFGVLSILVCLLLLRPDDSGNQVHAAENTNPLFQTTFEEYLKSSPNYPWTSYSNEKGLSRNDRLKAFASYYHSQLNTKVASAYGWPDATSFLEQENPLITNQTTSTQGDVYLVEFVTSNVVADPNIKLYWSIYYIQDNVMKYTASTQLSQLSKEFMGRSDRNKNLVQGEVEMASFVLPRNATPVGIYFWTDATTRFAWDFSYLNIYKTDSISKLYSYKDVGKNYRTFSGTRVAYIDAASINSKYMANVNGAPTQVADLEWLYPLSPDHEDVRGYILEVVTSGPLVATRNDHNRQATFTLKYQLSNGESKETSVPVNFASYYTHHPYTTPEDYDSRYDFTYASDYVNPIARNKKTDDPEDIVPTNDDFNDAFPDNNKPFREGYSMKDLSFGTLPTDSRYYFTSMNEFAGMMLGNYFDAYMMSTNYLKGYQAIQIPVVLPSGIRSFTTISSSGNTADGTGIQSIRVIQLSEDLAQNSYENLTSNGFYSMEAVLGIKGNVVAETTTGHPNLSATWSAGNANYNVVNYSKNKQIKVDTVTPRFQGVTVTFSDIYGAGFDNLLADVMTNFPSINSHDFPTSHASVYVYKTMTDTLGISKPLYNLMGNYYRDPITLTVTYRDQLDDIREVHIPFVTAYIMQLIMDNNTLGTSSPDTWISGIFQQGQTAGLRLNLSEYKSLISVKLSYGYGDQNPLSGRMRPMEGDAWYDDDDDERLPLYYDLSQDPIAIESISFYDDVTTSNFKASLDGLTSTIKTDLKASSSWQTSSDEGHSINQNQSFTAYRESREGSTVNMFDGDPLEEDYTDKYLVEITTLNTPAATTVSNLSYQLHYIDNYGNHITTSLGSILGASKNFYGNSSRNLTPFSTDFHSKIQYIMHLTAGSKICFLVEIPNLNQFEGITLTSDGTDEWQPEQIRILKPISISERFATRSSAFLANLSATDISDHLKNAISKNLGIPTYLWDRTYTGTVLASAAPNLLLHTGKTSARVNFTLHNPDGTTTAPDTVIEEVKYLEKIPTTMTYQDTLADLGLTVIKNTYQVNVDVANVTDAGSGNYFYFQLLFENGRSGLVLANQQLPSDTFRQGLTETFEIQTTQRYGELKAVRIICEATASTASTFDKLNIDKITVTLNSSQGTGKSWIVDRVGWIDINYVDEVQQSYADSDTVILDNKDLILDFPVTSISSSTELMFCINNGKLPNNANQILNMATLGDSIEGIITYTDFQNTTKTFNINIPQKIMAFNENESASRVLRSGTMDRFVVSLSDVKQIDSFTITRNEGKNSTWPISEITIQKVGGVGDVYLSAHTGEYIRDIQYSEYLTKSTSQNVSLDLNDSKTFHFEAHTIEADISAEDNNSWNSTITRYPVSSDDSVNIYVYLTNASGEPYKLASGDNIDISVVYSSSLGTGALKAGFKNIRAQAATETSSVLYAQDLSIQSLGSLKSIEIRGNFSSSLKPVVKCVYVEHVQGNVIKDTLYAPFNNASLALDKVTANFSNVESLTTMKQVVRLQPKEGTSAVLTPETSDIAVALRYTSSLDPKSTKMVYQSPYVFLTDAAYTVVNNRDHIEIPFYLKGVGEIVGLTVISSGPIVDFENALITNFPKPTITNGQENPVTTLLGSCSVAESFVSTNIISKMMKTAKSVTPVTFTFTTPKEELVAGCGTSGQVSMLITYTDTTKNQHTYRINNILDYLPLDNPPFSDTVTSFNIMLNDVAYLNSITLTPATDDWFLTEVNAKVTTYEGAKQTTVNKTAVVNQWAKAAGPLTIDMRPDSVNTDGPVINKITGFSISASAAQSQVTASATSGNPLNIKVVSGDTVTFTPTFQKVGDPTANINWSAYNYEAFFTDYSDGSAVFTVPSEYAIKNENLPRQYTLSAVCAENNSLAVPITITVITPEELAATKANAPKLTLMAVQDGTVLWTKSFGESSTIELKIPTDENGQTTADTTFSFMATLDKGTALFNVSNSSGLVSATSEGAYLLTVPNGTADGSAHSLTFNVADAETETTYSVTATVVLSKEAVENTMTAALSVDGQAVASEVFKQSSLVNALSYNHNFSAGNTNAIQYNLTSAITGVSFAIAPAADSNAAIAGIATQSTATGTFTIPTLDDLNTKLETAGKTKFAYGANGTVTVPYVFDVTLTIPGSGTSPSSYITGKITINVLYSNSTRMNLRLPNTGGTQADSTAPTDDNTPTDGTTPTNGTTPTGDDTPTGGTTTTNGTSPSGGDTPTGGNAPADIQLNGTLPTGGVADIVG